MGKVKKCAGHLYRQSTAQPKGWLGIRPVVSSWGTSSFTERWGIGALRYPSRYQWVYVGDTKFTEPFIQFRDLCKKKKWKDLLVLFLKLLMQNFSMLFVIRYELLFWRLDLQWVRLFELWCPMMQLPMFLRTVQTYQLLCCKAVLLMIVWEPTGTRWSSSVLESDMEGPKTCIWAGKELLFFRLSCSTYERQNHWDFGVYEMHTAAL